MEIKILGPGCPKCKTLEKVMTGLAILMVFFQFSCSGQTNQKQTGTESD